MVDPLSIAAVSAMLAGVLSGATNEAGASAYTGLVRLVNKALGAHHPATKALETGAPEVEVGELAELLVDAAASDTAVRAELTSWLEHVATGTDGATINTVLGDVHGSVVQGREFHGPLHLS